MFKTIARRSAVVLMLAAAVAPTSFGFAESTKVPPPPTIITGGDPQPTGESVTFWILLIPAIASV